MYSFSFVYTLQKLLVRFTSRDKHIYMLRPVFNRRMRLASSPSPRASSSTSKLRPLPRLPIPNLEKTVNRYLRTIEPFLENIAHRDGVSVDVVREQKRKLAEDFIIPGGLGRKLQERLHGSHIVSFYQIMLTKSN